MLLRDTEKYWPIEGVHVKLLRFGRGNRYMCSPYANLGKPPLEAFIIQLREARAEWRRRHPKTQTV